MLLHEFNPKVGIWRCQEDSNSLELHFEHGDFLWRFITNDEPYFGFRQFVNKQNFCIGATENLLAIHQQRLIFGYLRRGRIWSVSFQEFDIGTWLRTFQCLYWKRWTYYKISGFCRMDLHLISLRRRQLYRIHSLQDDESQLCDIA